MEPFPLRTTFPNQYLVNGNQHSLHSTRITESNVITAIQDSVIPLPEYLVFVDGQRFRLLVHESHPGLKFGMPVLENGAGHLKTMTGKDLPIIIYYPSPGDITSEVRSVQPHLLYVVLLKGTVTEIENETTYRIADLSSHPLKGLAYIPSNLLLGMRDNPDYHVFLDVERRTAMARTAWLFWKPSEPDVTPAFLKPLMSGDSCEVHILAEGVAKLISTTHMSVLTLMSGHSKESVVQYNNGVKITYVCRYGLAAKHISPSCMISIRKFNTRRNLQQNRLHLILDLDQTLLNSSPLNRLAANEFYMKIPNERTEGAYTPIEGTITKLRPQVKEFLRKASELFELSVYIMGIRTYAEAMVRLLDKDDEYFSERIVSREESKEETKKSLDIIHAEESTIIVLDDNDKVWKEDVNVIHVKPYHFFTSSNQQDPSLCARKSDEFGTLDRILQILQKIHHDFLYLHGQVDQRDVRTLMIQGRKEVLQGCHLYFSHVFRMNEMEESHPLWIKAEKLGANCYKQISDAVTHVISCNPLTENSQWALQQNRFLVSPEWLQETYYQWVKLKEEEFPAYYQQPI